MESLDIAEPERLSVSRADYSDRRQRHEIITLLDAYARDPMGGGEGLSDYTRCNLADRLAELPNAITLIAYLGEEPVGLLNAFEGFSTFACRPLINIHDLVVLENHRGRGVGSLLLQEAELIARSSGCCKLTLEVLSNNHTARSIYRKSGFLGYQLSDEAGYALFWEKKLSG